MITLCCKPFFFYFKSIPAVNHESELNENSTDSNYFATSKFLSIVSHSFYRTIMEQDGNIVLVYRKVETTK